MAWPHRPPSLLVLPKSTRYPTALPRTPALELDAHQLLKEAVAKVPGIVEEFNRLPKLYEKGEGVQIAEDDSHLG